MMGLVIVGAVYAVGRVVLFVVDVVSFVFSGVFFLFFRTIEVDWLFCLMVTRNEGFMFL